MIIKLPPNANPNPNSTVVLADQLIAHKDVHFRGRECLSVITNSGRYLIFMA